MKAVSLLLLLSLITNFAYCQNIVREGKLWSNTEIGSEVGSTYKSYFVKFEGDTTINGLQYNKIMKSFDESHSSWVADGFIREDTATQRVYTYRRGDAKEFLLYDFSLEVGDRLTYSVYESYQVEKVVYAPFSNSSEIRKQIYFGMPFPVPVWVEGIGNVQMGVLNKFEFFVTGGDYFMVCYFENDQLVYHNPRFTTCLPKGFNTSAEESIHKTAAVNITYQTDRVLLSFNEVGTSNSMLQFFSRTGEKIMESDLKGRSQFSFSTQSLSPGLYIYRYKNKEVNTSGKILIK